LTLYHFTSWKYYRNRINIKKVNSNFNRSHFWIPYTRYLPPSAICPETLK